MARIFVSARIPVDLPVDQNLEEEEKANNLRCFEWREVLVIPVDKLTTFNFSKFPFKWIRNAIGAVVGAEGHLYDHDDPERALEQIIDYTLPLPIAGDHHLYYYVPEEGLSSMFPLDLQFANPRSITSASQAETERQIEFRIEVEARDNGMCIVTQAPAKHCRAAHLVAHSKSSEVRIRSFYLSASYSVSAVYYNSHSRAKPRRWNHSSD